MPKVSLVLGRRTVQVYDFDQPTIRVGRSGDMDITIDNVSVSREHAQIVLGENGWLLRDLGSANGTFVNGERVDGSFPLRKGDEISIGKFSVFFDKVVGDAPTEVRPSSRSAAPESGGTMYIRPSDVKEMLRAAAERRQVQLAWKAGGQDGSHPLADVQALLVGSDELCDLRLPGGPRHPLLITRNGDGFEVRSLSLWRRMKVDGAPARRARLRDGNVIEVGGVELTFLDELG